MGLNDLDLNERIGADGKVYNAEKHGKKSKKKTDSDEPETDELPDDSTPTIFNLDDGESYDGLEDFDPFADEEPQSESNGKAIASSGHCQ